MFEYVSYKLLVGVAPICTYHNMYVSISLRCFSNILIIVSS